MIAPVEMQPVWALIDVKTQRVDCYSHDEQNPKLDWSEFGSVIKGDRRISQLVEASRLEAAEKERDALREALKELLPTPLCGEAWNLPDNETVEITVTFGEIKRARAILNGTYP